METENLGLLLAAQEQPEDSPARPVSILMPAGAVPPDLGVVAPRVEISRYEGSALMLLFLNVGGWLYIPVLLALGFTSLSTTPVLLAMAQEHFPHNRATANGVLISFFFLTRPIAAYAIGLMGDFWGLQAAFMGAALISLLAIPAIFVLPKAEHNEL